MKRYVSDLKYIGSGDYIPYLREEQPGDAENYDLVVLYDEAQARIEALEWLVDVQDFYMYRLRNPGGWATPGMERAKINVAWQRRSASNDELRAMYIAATEVKP